MNRVYLIFGLFVLSFISACVDRTFDEPEFLFEDPAMEVTKSIAALKSTHVNGQYETLSGGDIISGIVVANDKSGNFYETIVIADETGGIEVKIQKRSLFNTFPVGRRVFIKTDGLVLGDYNDLIQLGFSSTDSGFIGIPADNADEYVFGGSINNTFRVDTLSLSQLDENYMSTLVTLKDVQFADAELGYAYADALYKVTTNRILVDCAGNQVILRTSGYASFAAGKLPEGKGMITAVLSRYRNDLQLYLRDTTDIGLTGGRCGSGTGNETFEDIMVLRNNYKNGNASIGDDKKLKGTIISDRTHGNIHQNNVVLQDETGGIVLRFTDAHDLSVGDQVEVIVSGMELSDYNGLLQISNLQKAVVSKTGTGEVVPAETTVGEILANAENRESTLVLIKNANFSGGSVYSDALSVSDGSGSIPMYTRSVADFAQDAVPNGTVDIVAIISDFNGAQLNLRSKNDVSGGTIDPPADVIFQDGFDSGIGNWINYSVLGDQVWQYSAQYGNPGACARVSGFDGGSHANEDWLISPGIDLSDASKGTLKFETAKNYSGNDLELYVSEDYDGTGNPTNFSWEKRQSNLSTGSWTWTGSGSIDLSDYTGGVIYFAFKFTSTDQESATWEVDNVEVSVVE